MSLHKSGTSMSQFVLICSFPYGKQGFQERNTHTMRVTVWGSVLGNHGWELNLDALSYSGKNVLLHCQAKRIMKTTDKNRTTWVYSCQIKRWSIQWSLVKGSQSWSKSWERIILKSLSQLHKLGFLRLSLSDINSIEHNKKLKKPQGTLGVLPSVDLLVPLSPNLSSSFQNC